MCSGQDSLMDEGVFGKAKCKTSNRRKKRGNPRMGEVRV